MTGHLGMALEKLYVAKKSSGFFFVRAPFGACPLVAAFELYLDSESIQADC